MTKPKIYIAGCGGMLERPFTKFSQMSMTYKPDIDVNERS